MGGELDVLVPPLGGPVLTGDDAHAEAIARISSCVVESALSVVTEDSAQARPWPCGAAVSGLDPTRHQVIYIANPAFGVGAASRRTMRPNVRTAGAGYGKCGLRPVSCD